MQGPRGGYSAQAAAAIAATITFLVLFTVAGNGLVILAVLSSRSLRAPQNLFLVSLAAADILVATIIIPFSLANELLGYWYFQQAWCQLYLALDVLFCTSSIVHLCAISLDRYWAVSRAVLCRTRRRVKLSILLVWTIAAIISLPPLLYKGERRPAAGEERPQCRLNEEAWYVLSSSVGSFFAPCLIMVLVYLRIYLIARRRHRARTAAAATTTTAATAATTATAAATAATASVPPPLPPSSAQPLGTCPPPDPAEPLSSGEPPVSPRTGSGTVLQPRGQPRGQPKGQPMDALDTGTEPSPQPRAQPRAQPKDTLATGSGQVVLARGLLALSTWRRKAQLKREQRFTVVLAVVIGAFVLCWFPFFFLYSLGALCPQRCKVPDGVFQFFFWVGYLNSSLNPLIYTIFNPDFRTAFRRLLCCRRPAPTPC